MEGVGALKEIGEWAKRELEDDVGGQVRLDDERRKRAFRAA